MCFYPKRVRNVCGHSHAAVPRQPVELKRAGKGGQLRESICHFADPKSVDRTLGWLERVCEARSGRVMSLNSGTPACRIAQFLDICGARGASCASWSASSCLFDFLRTNDC
jgi:hypothetical protein